MTQRKKSPGSHRREHLYALTEVADERHDGHLLHEPLDLTELHHEAVLVRQALHRLALLLELPQDFNLVLRGLEAHQTLHEVHRQGSQVKAKRRGGRKDIFMLLTLETDYLITLTVSKKSQLSTI